MESKFQFSLQSEWCEVLSRKEERCCPLVLHYITLIFLTRRGSLVKPGGKLGIPDVHL